MNVYPFLPPESYLIFVIFSSSKFGTKLIKLDQNKRIARHRNFFTTSHVKELSNNYRTEHVEQTKYQIT